MPPTDGELWAKLGPFLPLKVGPTLGYGVDMHSPAATTLTFKLAVNEPERVWLEHEARAAGLSVANLLRQKLGLRARPMGRPTAAQLEQMEDDAWGLLTQIGVDPARYFPKEPAHVPSENEESVEDREARIARIQAIAAGRIPPQ